MLFMIKIWGARGRKFESCHPDPRRAKQKCFALLLYICLVDNTAEDICNAITGLNIFIFLRFDNATLVVKDMSFCY